MTGVSCCKKEIDSRAFPPEAERGVRVRQTLYTENNRMDTNFISELTQIVGADGIRASNAEKQVYAFDAYTLEKQIPGVVVLPRSTEEVSAIARLCHANGVSMVPRGSGTGLAGGATAAEDQVLISTARMNRVLQVDVPNRRLRAQTGVYRPGPVH